MTDIWLPNTTKHYIQCIDKGPRPQNKGLVLHINDGTFAGTISWFENSKRQELTGAHFEFGDGKAWQLLPLGRKAWHAGAANEFSVGLEHAGVEAWTRSDWLNKHHTELALSANRGAWILHEYNLGRPKLNVNVWRHSYGGAAWGGHACPGPNFPVDMWLKMCTDAYLGHWGRK
jgi:hypothetical protein